MHSGRINIESNKLFKKDLVNEKTNLTMGSAKVERKE